MFAGALKENYETKVGSHGDLRYMNNLNISTRSKCINGLDRWEATYNLCLKFCLSLVEVNCTKKETSSKQVHSMEWTVIVHS